MRDASHGQPIARVGVIAKELSNLNTPRHEPCELIQRFYKAHPSFIKA
jgi:hypothetical protein